MYKVVRHFLGRVGPDGHYQSWKRTISTGLTLEQAQEHCSRPETSSRTATSPKARARTRKYGPWFDGYQET